MSLSVTTPPPRDPARNPSEPMLSGSFKQGTTSAWGLAVNLITSGLGIGVLSLPWSAAGASIIPGAMVTACMFLIMAWTSCIIVEAGEKHQTFDLGSLLALIPGRLGVFIQGLSNLIIWVSGIMCMIGYTMVVADTVQPLIPGDRVGFVSSRTAGIIGASIVALLLCFLEQRYLAFSSSLAIFVNIYLFCLVAYAAMADRKPTTQSVCVFGLGRGLISMSSTLCQALAIQIYCLPFYETLEGRSVAKYRRVVFSSVAFLFVLFVAFETAALYAYGPGILQNVLQELQSGAAGDAARFGMIPVVLACYPIVMIPRVAPIRKAFGGRKSVEIGAIVGIAVICMVFGIFVTELGVLNVINGAMTVVVIDALCPALVGLYLLQKNRGAMILLIIAGMAMTILGFCFTNNYVSDLEVTCLWS